MKPRLSVANKIPRNDAGIFYGGKARRIYTGHFFFSALLFSTDSSFPINSFYHKVMVAIFFFVSSQTLCPVVFMLSKTTTTTTTQLPPSATITKMNLHSCHRRGKISKANNILPIASTKVDYVSEIHTYVFSYSLIKACKRQVTSYLFLLKQTSH